VAGKTQNCFAPVFTITPAIARALMRIEAARQAVHSQPVTPRVLARLRETARLFTTHYSTLIEGNRLTQEQVAKVIGAGQHFPGRERDQDEVQGYYAALDEVERLAGLGERVTEAAVRRLHAQVMSGGRARVKPTPYRDGQNVIRDSRSNEIVYLPPEAQDVPRLMAQLIAWLSADVDPGEELPVPVKAAIAHYQYATIHPYYDGNGRTARLLTTLVLHLGGYGLKGLYALEEYYARDLGAYYEALTIGSSHNYYWAGPRPTSRGGLPISLREWRIPSRECGSRPAARPGPALWTCPLPCATWMPASARRLRSLKAHGN
jgi:Fic family protein